MNKETIKHEKERICPVHGLPNCCPQFKHEVLSQAPTVEEKITEREREIGFTCEVCHGEKASVSGDVIVHLCDGVLLPIATPPVQNEWEVDMIKPVLDFVFSIEKDINPKAKEALKDDEYLIRGPEIEERLWKLLSKVRAATLEEVKKCVPEFDSMVYLPPGEHNDIPTRKAWNECRRITLEAINKLN